MDLVLDKEIDQRHESAEEGTSQIFPVLDSLRIWGAEGQAPGGPRDGKDDIRDHQNVVPVVVIRRRDVRPASAGQCPNNARDRNRLG